MTTHHSPRPDTATAHREGSAATAAGHIGNPYRDECPVAEGAWDAGWDAEKEVG